MVATSETIAIVGAEARLVQVEVHIGQGIPSFTIVGLAARSVKEAEQRTRAALLSSDQAWPSARITANLAPGALRKEGTHFDLPLALGLLAERRAADPTLLEGWVSLGELALDGSVRPVRGVLAAAIATLRAGRRGLICPVANAPEASLVEGLEVVPVASLRQCLEWLRGAETPSPRSCASRCRNRVRIFERSGATPPPSAPSRSQPPETTTCYWSGRPARARPCWPAACPASFRP